MPAVITRIDIRLDGDIDPGREIRERLLRETRDVERRRQLAEHWRMIEENRIIFPRDLPLVFRAK